MGRHIHDDRIGMARAGEEQFHVGSMLTHPCHRPNGRERIEPLPQPSAPQHYLVLWPDTGPQSLEHLATVTGRR